MITRLTLVFLFISSMANAVIANSDPSKWDIASVKIVEVADEAEALDDFNIDDCVSDNADISGIGWSDIINIGQKAWQLVLDNKPVLHTKTPVAHALPKGLTCWTDLEKWSNPQMRSYEVLYTNGFGQEVVKFRFRLHHTYGGRKAGTGRYIANATILPSQVDVNWGYKFNAILEVGKPVNIGTNENPVAGLEMNLRWKVSTLLKESQSSVHFFVTGDGDVQVAE